MSWFTIDLKQKTCLTCQHFKGVPRKLRSVGRALHLEYDAQLGGCGLFNNFPRLINQKAGWGSFCHYSRWRNLPDL